VLLGRDDAVADGAAAEVEDLSPSLDLTQRLADDLEVDVLDLLQGRPAPLPRRRKSTRK
jgi:hypothetical protein